MKNYHDGRKSWGWGASRADTEPLLILPPPGNTYLPLDARLLPDAPNTKTTDGVS